MPNMSYIKFENTLEDLRDCNESLDEFYYGELSESEAKAAERLIDLCRRIAECYDEDEVKAIMKQYQDN